MNFLLCLSVTSPMMMARRDGLMRNTSNSHQSLRASRIAIAIGIGVFMGCIFAFLYPNGFFHYDVAIASTHFSRSKLQVLSPMPFRISLFDFTSLHCCYLACLFSFFCTAMIYFFCLELTERVCHACRESIGGRAVKNICG